MANKGANNFILKEGIFAKQFPVINEIVNQSNYDISNNEYKDLVEVSNNFKGKFYNAGYMKNYKVCSLYMLAHNAALEVQQKQTKRQ